MNSEHKNAVIDLFRQERPKNYMWKRFFALLIDFVAIAFLCQLVFILFGMPDWARYMQSQETVAGLPATDPLVLERIRLYQECFIITLGIAAAYEALTLSFFRGSPGKLILGLRVVFVKQGRNFLIDNLLLALRCVIKMLSIYLLSAIPFIFMCLTAFGNIDRRSGFDMFVGTKVVDVRGDK